MLTFVSKVIHLTCSFMRKDKDLHIHQLFLKIKNGLGIKLILVPIVGLLVFVLLFINWYSPKVSYYKSDMVINCDLLDNQHVSSFLNKNKSDFIEPFKDVRNIIFYKVDTNKTSFIVRAEIHDYKVLDSLKLYVNTSLLNSDLFNSSLIKHNEKLGVEIEKCQKRSLVNKRDSVENLIKIDSLNRLKNENDYLELVSDFNYNYVQLGKSIFPTIFATIASMLFLLLALVLLYYKKIKE